jgi:hypothetical protein
VLPGQVGERVDRIEVAGVDLAGVPDDHRRRAAQLVEAASHRLQVDPPGTVAGEDLDRVPPVSQHLQRLARARVHVTAGQHRHPGQPSQPVPDRIGAQPLTPPVRGAAERGEVRERRARHQRPAPALGQAEQGTQPVQRHRLRLGTERRRRPGERVLVQQRRGPIRGQPGRCHATADEVEEPRPGRGGAGRGADLEQTVDRGGRAVALLGQRTAELGQ